MMSIPLPFSSSRGSNDFVIQISAHRYGSEVSIERFERKLEIGFDPRPSVRLISIDCRSSVV